LHLSPFLVDFPPSSFFASQRLFTPDSVFDPPSLSGLSTVCLLGLPEDGFYRFLQNDLPPRYFSFPCNSPCANPFPPSAPPIMMSTFLDANTVRCSFFFMYREGPRPDRILCKSCTMYLCRLRSPPIFWHLVFSPHRRVGGSYLLQNFGDTFFPTSRLRFASHLSYQVMSRTFSLVAITFRTYDFCFSHPVMLMTPRVWLYVFSSAAGFAFQLRAVPFGKS